jgi:ribosomal protein S18 acetylase RimI-like enzyme
MTDARVRAAKASELDAVYRMGYDAWGDSRPLADYLRDCAASPKYRRGVWHVLDGGTRLLSALIVYELGPGAAGIGSLATPPEERRRGRASALIAGVLKLLDARGVGAVYLYSDIAPRFYERFGFRALPAALQRYPGRVGMIRGAAALATAPDYF